MYHKPNPNTKITPIPVNYFYSPTENPYELDARFKYDHNFLFDLDVWMLSIPRKYAPETIADLQKLLDGKCTVYESPYTDIANIYLFAKRLTSDPRYIEILKTAVINHDKPNKYHPHISPAMGNQVNLLVTKYFNKSDKEIGDEYLKICRLAVEGKLVTAITKKKDPKIQLEIER